MICGGTAFRRFIPFAATDNLVFASDNDLRHRTGVATYPFEPDHCTISGHARGCLGHCHIH